MLKMIKLKFDCVNCKYLCMYPSVCCDIGVETQCFYIDKEETTFRCRPKYAVECKNARLLKQNETM